MHVCVSIYRLTMRTIDIRHQTRGNMKTNKKSKYSSFVPATTIKTASTQCMKAITVNNRLARTKTKTKKFFFVRTRDMCESTTRGQTVCSFLCFLHSSTGNCSCKYICTYVCPSVRLCI